MVPKEEIANRIGRLQDRLVSGGLDGALVLYAVDVYYFTGTRQNACLWVPAAGAPSLFVRKSLIRAVEDGLVEDIRPFPSGREFSAFLAEAKRIGVTFDVLPVQHYQFYRNLLGESDLVDASAAIRELRSVKSEWELSQMRMSGHMLAQAFSEIPGFLRPGIRELDLAAEFEYRLRRSGIGGYLRIRGFNQEITGLVSAGENAALPGCFDGPVTGKGHVSAAPYGPSDTLLTEGIPIIVDYGGFFNGYITDMTRIFAIGKLDPDLVRAFRISLDIQSRIVENLRPGSQCDELYNGAVHMAASAGLAVNFMGHPSEPAKFVGHGVGLELDELPILAGKFKSAILAGQTLAVEPKFLFPGRGAIGIENSYAVTQAGCEKLTDMSDEIVFL